MDEKTGWSSENAAAIVAGNGGLGNVFPPSSVMLLVLGLDEVSKRAKCQYTLYGAIGCRRNCFNL